MLLRKILLTLCVLTFGAIVPILEVNHTHVFNPLWPGHARLHEVWQLLTNCSIALLCLWLAWTRDTLRAAAALALSVTASFLAAWLLADSYGGSMKHTDGTEIAIAGVNVAAIVMAVASAVLLGIIARPHPAKQAALSGK